MKSLQNKKGFTLIELIVVIAIIGVLATALLPKLTGVQERSRDAARVASLNSVAAVLQTYYSDLGSYPLSPSNTTNIDDSAGTLCLSSSNGTVHNDLGLMMQGGLAPIDPQLKMRNGWCGTDASFGYSALQKNGINQNSYILIADMELFRNANATLENHTTAPTNMTSGGITYENIQSATASNGIASWGKPRSEATNAKNTVYVLIQ